MTTDPRVAATCENRVTLASGAKLGPCLLEAGHEGMCWDGGNWWMPVSAGGDEIEAAWQAHTFADTRYTSDERQAFESGWKAAVDSGRERETALADELRIANERGDSWRTQVHADVLFNERLKAQLAEVGERETALRTENEDLRDANSRACTSYAELSDELAIAKAAVTALRAALAALVEEPMFRDYFDSSGNHDGVECAYCHAEAEGERTRHASDCVWAAARVLLDGPRPGSEGDAM